MIASFQSRLKPMVLKRVAIQALRVFVKYSMVVKRMEHVKRKRALRALYQHMRERKAQKNLRLLKVKAAESYQLRKYF